MEIKFRLRNCLYELVGYEKWYSGSLDSQNFYTARPCWQYSVFGDYWNPQPIKHRWKEKFTGLFDKKGIEIYEGDIVRGFHCEYINGVRHENMPNNREIGKVIFGSFKVNTGCSGHGMGNDSQTVTGFYVDKHETLNLTQLEVIGTVYENPELLKEK